MFLFLHMFYISFLNFIRFLYAIKLQYDNITINLLENRLQNLYKIRIQKNTELYYSTDRIYILTQQKIIVPAPAGFRI